MSIGLRLNIISGLFYNFFIKIIISKNFKSCLFYNFFILIVILKLDRVFLSIL